MVKRVEQVSRFEQRFWEIIPAALSWGFLFMPLLLVPFVPLYVTYFILLFDLYWLFRSAKFSYCLLRTYSKLRRNLRIDWYQKLLSLPGATDLYHVVLQTMYKEDISVLRSSLQALAAANYDRQKIIYVLAAEERDPNARRVAAQLQAEFDGSFKKFIVTFHPDGIPGEVAGRGSNMAWSMRQLERELIQADGLDTTKVIVSALDADARVHPGLLANLSYRFLKNKKRHQAIYQFLPLFHNNLWDVPAMMRVVAVGCSFWMMIEMARPRRLRSFSCYAVSWAAVQATGYWASDSIIEDGIQYWRQFFACDGDFRVVPIGMPIYMDAVLGKNYLQTYLNQYKQLKRWAWGASDLAYVMPTFLRDRKISLISKLVQVGRLLEGHLTWATAPLLLLAGGQLPLLNASFNQTVIGHNLPQFTSGILSLAMFGLGISILISWAMQPMRASHGVWTVWRYFVTIIQWLMLPVVTVLFGAFPALDSQTRLALGQKMGFICTEKRRKLGTVPALMDASS